jgi:hypothetical protein
VLETLLSVLNTDKPHKDGTMKSESKITICDRMQMIRSTTFMHLYFYIILYRMIGRAEHLETMLYLIGIDIKSIPLTGIGGL